MRGGDNYLYIFSIFILEKCKSLLRQVILDALFGQVGLGAEATDIQYLGCEKDCNGQ